MQDEEYHEDQEEEEEGTNATNATIQSNDFANEEKSVDENLEEHPGCAVMCCQKSYFILNSFITPVFRLP